MSRLILNWKTEDIALTVGVHDRFQTKLVLSLKKSQIEVVLSHFSQILAGELAELRWDLPQGWTLYFKLREGGSKVLLAHPQEKDWIATLMFGSSHLQKFTTALRAGAVTLSQVADLNHLSNLELIVHERHAAS